MKEQRGSWYLLTGLVFGVVLGLFYAWAIRPVMYTNTSPAFLGPEIKDKYRAMIALAYLADGDLTRAKARLDLLKDPDEYQALAGQAQRSLADGSSAQEAQALGLLSIALGKQSGSAENSSQAQPSPSPSSTSSQGALFALDSRDQVCDPNLKEPLIQVQAQDASGNPLPGVEVIINWEGGEDRFFTGLKPELGAGYGDFTMLPDQVYSLRLQEGGELVSDLAPVECKTSSGEAYPGGWLLVFKKP